jgi:CheY-like chemotaxis protein
LQQVFWNVLKNAVKFTPQGGKISVETHTPGDSTLCVKISDTGIGLNPEEIDHIFDAFSQGVHSGFGGLGLGLAISRKLIEQHGGSIRAISDGKEKGATFFIELTLVQRPKAEAARTDVHAPKAFQPVPGKKPAHRVHILLVEDHEPTRAALTHLLARRNHKVTSAASLNEARSCVEKDKKNFDLVISDIGLPDGSGYDLMSELRENCGLKGIALTGYGMEQDVNRSLDAGFVAHLTKPVRMESLDSALGTALNQPA